MTGTLTLTLPGPVDAVPATLYVSEFSIDGSFVLSHPVYVSASVKHVFPATSAFRLIPVGYLSFLILALVLVWLMTRLQIKRAWPGGISGDVDLLKV